jgi:hypothetical protein
MERGLPRLAVPGNTRPDIPPPNGAKLYGPRVYGLEMLVDRDAGQLPDQFVRNVTRSYIVHQTVRKTTWA